MRAIDIVILTLRTSRDILVLVSGACALCVVLYAFNKWRRANADVMSCRDGFYDALETVADDTAEKASPEEVSEDQPMEEVAQVVESSDSSSDSDTS